MISLEQAAALFSSEFKVAHLDETRFTLFDKQSLVAARPVLTEP